MQTVSITVEVPVTDLTPEAIHEAVVRHVASRALGVRTIADPETGEEYTTTEEPLLKTMRTAAADAVTIRVKELVEREIPPVIQDVLSGTFQPMTRWGDKAGAPTTIREMIGKEATAWLTDRVDSEGRVMTGYNRDQGTVRLHWLVRKEVEVTWKAVIAEETAKIATDVRKQLADKINAEIAAVVSRIAGTK